MVDILADIIQVIVFTSGSDTLLSVDSSLLLGHVTVGVHCANKYWLELVHASIGKQESWIIQGNGRGGVDIQMVILKKIIKSI